MKKITPTRVSLALAAAFCSQTTLAVDAPSGLPELEEVVTASRVPTPRTGLAGTVQVLSAEAIQNSTARSVQELLASQVGIVTRNADGSSDVVLDLRGFGASGPSNTLLLVNGVRQNDNDLSAARLSQIPLSAIERIEIVRGSGAVQYGGGATGGVINIITKRPFAPQPWLELSARGGDYHTSDMGARVNLQGEAVALTVQGTRLRTHNYRDNNADLHDRFLADLNWSGEHDTLGLSVGADRQRLGLPGAITLAQWQINPEVASTPNDYAVRRGEQWQANWRHDLGRASLYLDVAAREKESHAFLFGGWDDRNLVTRTASPRVAMPFVTGTIRHRLVAGLDALNSRADIDSFGTRWETRQRQRALFLEEQASFEGGAQLTVGVRKQRFKDEVVAKSAFAVSHVLEGHLYANELGASLPLGSGVTVFGKVGRSFRLANADELVFTTGAIKPQESRDRQAGIQWQQGDWHVGATVYRHDLKDEIHFNALTFTNMNLEPTRRQGLELDAGWKMSPKLSLNGNATFQKATFRSGVYGGVDVTGNEVPLVPRHMANLSMHWQATATTGVDVTARYVGKQRLENDQANSTSLRLPSYTVVDVAVGQRYTDWSWRLGINNLFDERYSDYGIRNGAGTSYNLYPSPGRNAMLTLTYAVQ